MIEFSESAIKAVRRFILGSATPDAAGKAASSS